MHHHDHQWDRNWRRVEAMARRGFKGFGGFGKGGDWGDGFGDLGEHDVRQVHSWVLRAELIRQMHTT